MDTIPIPTPLHRSPPSSAVMAEPPPESTRKLKFMCAKNLILFFLITVAISMFMKFLEEITHLYGSMHFTSRRLLCTSFLIVYFFLKWRQRPIYLVDYGLFKPPRCFRASNAAFFEHGRIVLAADPGSIRFQWKILERSGLGEETSIPPAMHYIPPTPDFSQAKEEAELVIFSAMDALFEKTKLKPREVDILILNCSLYSPTPSMTAMVINRYKMRNDVKSFNLTGMGCSAGLIGVDLARNLLKCYPNSNAVVISTEILTPFSYLGKDKSMLLPNVLFRMGGAAVLLSNRRADRRRAKYRLLHVVRTHRGADDKSYGCVSQEEDSEGIIGVRLNQDLVAVAGKTMNSNIAAVGPLVLPASEKFLFALSLIRRKINKSKWKPYIPNFKRAFEHFCIHAGGRAVIDEMQKSFSLSNEQVEASRMTLHKFGNTSSSSLWYELSYIESKGRMKKGDRVWQIAFGSGFKCNNAVWKCNRTIKSPVEGPWADCIDKYPVHIPEVVKL